jgi:protein TonB|tara:strand:- start:276 stop:599 length:324 start_codon:yes stop_codon:yes gene_type:complete
MDEAESRRRAALSKKITSKASVVSRSTPTYPKSVQRKKQEGRVVVAVSVGTSGRVTSSRVTSSSRNAALDSAALKAARKFRFKPPINGLGKAVTTKISIPLTFKPRS